MQHFSSKTRTTGLLFKAAKACSAVGRGLLVLPLVGVLLFAVFLIIFAPIPQLMIHVRWCRLQLGFPGHLILALGFLGVVLMVLGFKRKRTAMRRAGLMMFTLPIIGCALHRSVTTSDWSEISLLAAMLFSTLLIYAVAVDWAPPPEPAEKFRLE